MSAEQQIEQLRDALADILDICTGWSRKMSDEEKLTLIGKLATKAHRDSSSQRTDLR